MRAHPGRRVKGKRGGAARAQARLFLDGGRGWGGRGGAFPECSENLGRVPRVEGLSRLKGCAFPRYRGRPDFGELAFPVGLVVYEPLDRTG